MSYQSKSAIKMCVMGGILLSQVADGTLDGEL
jgi:hypothetical protein